MPWWDPNRRVISSEDVAELGWRPNGNVTVVFDPADEDRINNAVRTGVAHQHFKTGTGPFVITYLRPPPTKLRLYQPNPDAQPYRYSTLPSGSIRLLKRRPHDDPNLLAFEFFTSSLAALEAENQDYVAISYCWGDLPSDRRLGVGDNLYVPVTTKVEHMLFELVARWLFSNMSDGKRSRDEGGEQSRSRQGLETPMIWLDAVCINQADMSEKALQIPLMADIYRNASAVSIWLDCGTASHNMLKKAYEHRLMSDVAHFEAGMSREQHTSWNLEPYSTRELTQLMWSPWFTRAWVVQEFASSQNFHFHYRENIITVTFLNMTYEWGSDLAFTRVLDEGKTRCEVPVPPLIGNMQQLFELRDQVGRNTNYLRSLEEVITRFYHTETRDPRDKIYALLGLVKQDGLDAIEVSYDISAPDLYLKVMDVIARSYTNYSLLSFAGLAAPRPLFKDVPNIPSWLPDFSTPPCHTTWARPLRSFNASGIPDNAVVQSFCAWYEDANTPKIRALKVHGLCCGTVNGVLRGDERHNLARIPKFTRKAMAAVESLRPYPSGESARDVLWKTLIAANPDCLQRDPAGKSFDHIQNLARQGSNSFTLDEIWASEGRYLQTMIIEGTAGSRGIFWTDTGYVGLAANEVEVGDKVYIVTGARVPFIFRGPVMAPLHPSGHRWEFYRLVCETYVHGIMDGEMGVDKDKVEVIFLI